MRQFLRYSAFTSLLLLAACQTGGANRAGGSGAAFLPGNYLGLGNTVLDDADDLKDLANQAGSVAGAADMCRLPTDMMDKEIRELSELIPDFGSALPKGFFGHAYLIARKNIAAKAERGSCDANSRQGIERMYADLVINLQSPHLRSWIRALPR